MRVFLVRHGHAVSAGPTVSDDARWLTARGRGALALIGARLREIGVVFDAVVTSPLVRAVQTAELLAAGVGHRGEIETVAHLAPDGARVQLAADDLVSRGDAVCAVGHEPSISALAAWLIGARQFASFRPGQVVLVEDGAPVWLLDPDTCEVRKLGGSAG